MPAVPLVIDALAIDCTDPLTVGRFWHQLLGGDLREARDGDQELHGAAVRLDFLRVPEPKQTVKNRLHLDLHVAPEQRHEAIAQALSLGATPADDIYDGVRWKTLRDPEANEFCIVWGAGD